MANVNIKGLDKAAVLAALHNGTRALGMGAFHDRGRMSVDDARRFIDAGKNDIGHPRTMGEGALRFDYVQGRPIKVDISGDDFDPRLYDRDAGEGAAERAIAPLLKASAAE